MKSFFNYAVGITVILLLPTISLAQSNMFYYQPTKTWDFGPRIGFTTSMINSKGDPNLKRGFKWGIVGGAYGRYQMADQWAINADLAYSSRGNKNDASNIENGYLDFSITPLRNVKYRMFKQDMTFDFFVGPGISVLISAIDKNGVISNLENELATTEFNIVLGGGFPIGPVLLYATTRFGVSNLLAKPQPGSKWHGFTTEWTISYRLGKKNGLKE